MRNRTSILEFESKTRDVAFAALLEDSLIACRTGMQHIKKERYHDFNG